MGIYEALLDPDISSAYYGIPFYGFLRLYGKSVVAIDRWRRRCE